MSLAFSLVGIVAWVLLLIRNPKKWGYFASPISWLVHVAAFYTWVFIRITFDISYGASSLNDWSSIVRLHAVLLVAGNGLTLLACQYFDCTRKKT